MGLPNHKYADLRYLKTIHKVVEYWIVYDISDERKEVLGNGRGCEI